MKALKFIVIILFLTSCNFKHNQEPLLSQLKMNIEESPNDALIKLDSLKNTSKFTHSEKLQWDLLYIRAYEEKYFQLPCESLVSNTASILCDKGNQNDKAYCYFYLGRLYSNQNKFNKSMAAYLQALDYAKQTCNHRLAGLICSYIAKIYKKDKEYIQAINTLKQANSYYKLANKSRSSFFALIDIGSSFSYLSLSDSSLKYFAMAEVIARQLNDKELLADTYFQISKTNWSKNELSSANFYLTECIKQSQDSSLLMKSKLLQVQILIAQKDFSTAKTVMLPLLVTDLHTSLANQASNCISMAKIEKGLLNFEDALKWNETYLALYDSIINIRLKTDTPVIELTKKISELEILNKQRKANNHLIFSITILLFIGSITFFILYYKSNKKKKYYEQEIQINIKHLNSLQQEFDNNSILLSKINLLSHTPTHKQTEIKNALEELSIINEITAEDWTVLEEKTNREHHNVLQLLKIKYPLLTNEDIQTIILILLGLASGEIATILHIEMASLKKRRQRLRQRLALKEEENLETFFTHITDNQ